MRRMFSEKQIKRMLEESPQEILKALQEQDLKVKTIEQSEANWSLDFSETSLVNFPASAEYETPYARLEQIGNVLYIVWLVKITNPTENAISISNWGIEIELPENIAKKIYDFEGKTVHESSNGAISADIAFRGDQSYPLAMNRVSMNYLINNIQDANKLQIACFGWGGINAGQTQIACFRTFLTLL